jgi:hypothetical protein
MSQMNQAQGTVKLKKSWSHLKRWGQVALLSVGAGLLCWGPRAQAAENITLKYNDFERTFDLAELQSFARTGRVSSVELRLFTQMYPQASTLLQTALSQEIAIDAKAEKEIGSNIIGEFVLLQLNKFLRDPARQDNLPQLQSAVVAAYADDGRVSLLEVVERYPESEIQVDLNQVEQAYVELGSFVEQVQPVLDALNNLFRLLGRQ